MRVILAFICAFLIASAQCQQAITLENCLYDIGVLVADISLVYKDRSNRQYLQKARADLQTLYNHCAVVLPASLGEDIIQKMMAKREAREVARNSSRTSVERNKNMQARREARRAETKTETI